MPEGELQFPRMIRGTVYEADGTTPVADTKVYLYDSTADLLLLTTTANGLGQYAFDLDEATGWADGDNIVVIAGKLMAKYVISSLTPDALHDYRFLLDVEFTNNTFGLRLITSAGLNMARDWLRGNSTTTLKGVGWGTGTTDPAAADTFLELEKERNAFGSQSRVRNKTKFETLLDYTEANGNSLTKSGLFTQAAGGGSGRVTINTNKGGERLNLTVD